MSESAESFTHWNYRVIRRVYPHNDIAFYVAECYYRDGKVIMMTDPIAPIDESTEDLIDTLARMVRACVLPVVKYEDVVTE